MSRLVLNVLVIYATKALLRYYIKVREILNYSPLTYFKVVSIVKTIRKEINMDKPIIFYKVESLTKEALELASQHAIMIPITNVDDIRRVS